MDIYLVRDKEFDTYLLNPFKWLHLVTWGEQQHATVYTDPNTAYQAGMWAFQWVAESKEKFDVIHLVARDETDSRPFTKDGKLILSGKHYWRTNTHGVERVRVEKISATYYSATGRVECYCRLDIDFWSPPECLYSTEPLAWVAWKEEQ